MGCIGGHKKLKNFEFDKTRLMNDSCLHLVVVVVKPSHTDTNQLIGTGKIPVEII